MTENEMVELARITNEIMNQTGCGYILAKKAAIKGDMSLESAVEYIRTKLQLDPEPECGTL